MAVVFAQVGEKEPRLLCNESTSIFRGPAAAKDWPSPWRFGWAKIRHAITEVLEQPADFFRQMSVRRQHRWLLTWFSATAGTNIWQSGCPIGVLTLRVFTVLISNDADRCIQMRDARLGLDLLHIPFADVAASGWPVFNILGKLAEESRRISYPLDNFCDKLDSEAAVTFRLLLLEAFAGQGQLPVAQALDYLRIEPSPTTSSERRLSLRAPASCPFGAALAHVAMASALNHGNAQSAINRSLDSDCPGGAPLKDGLVQRPVVCIAPESRDLLAKSQKLLKEWLPLGRSLYDLITTKWPVWQSLERVSKFHPEGSAIKTHLQVSADVDLIFCGMGFPRLKSSLQSFSDARGWRLHYLCADSLHCPTFYQQVSQTLGDSSPLVMLSPLLWGWDASMEDSILRAIAALTPSEVLPGFEDHPGSSGGGLSADVVGFPTLDESWLWGFDVWRVRRGNWSLRYEAFPTGYAKTQGDRCFGSDATSASRVFRRAELWRRLVGRLGAWDRPDPQDDRQPDDLSWLVDLDLEMRAEGLEVFTCMAQPMHENAYLESVTLGRSLARKYLLETAHFSASNSQERCLELSDVKAVSGSSNESVLPPPCLEREAQLALRTAVGRWGAGGSSQLRLSSDSSNARLLLTGTKSMLPLGFLEPAPVVLTACCSTTAASSSPAADAECGLWGMTDEWLAKLPPELSLHRDASSREVLFKSERLDLPLLQVRRCSAESSTTTFEVKLSGEEPGFLTLAVPSEETSPSRPAGSAFVHVLLCPALEAVRQRLQSLAEARGWTLHTGPTVQVGNAEHESPEGCFQFLRSTVEQLEDQSLVVLLSPLLRDHEWAPTSAARAITEGMQRMLSPSSRHVEVLGFPTVTPSGGWKLNVRNLRHQYWKLVYSQIQTPAAEVWPESAEACAWGSASSGSRIFRSASKLKMLLSQVSADPDNAYNWMVDLDLQMLHAGIRALTCASYPLLEADYLSMTTLTKHLTTKHQVEVAEFLEGSRHVYCIKGANWFEVARKGLVAPWCFRRDVVKTFSSVQQWWTSLDPRNFVVPEEGTFLALFRNGAAGMLPWDSDFDMKLYTEADITMEGFMNRTLDPPFRSMEIEAYAYDGCGQDNYVLLRRPNITHHIGDVYVRGGQARADHPWRANLFGVQVSLSPGHLEHIFFTRYRTPVQKLFGDGIPLQCVYVGHNACLPDCRNQDEPCEFEDNFVHVDHFASDSNG